MKLIPNNGNNFIPECIYASSKKQKGKFKRQKQTGWRKKERKKEVFVLRAALNTKHKSSMPRTNVVKSTRISYSGTKKNAEKITHK